MGPSYSTMCAGADLAAHMQRYSYSEILRAGTYACERYDMLYIAWIRARWDDGDRWVRVVWTTRP